MGRAAQGRHRYSSTMAVVELRRLFDEGAQDTKTLIAAMDKKGYPREVTQAALSALEKLNIMAAVPETRQQERTLSEAKAKADQEFIADIVRRRR